MSDTKQSRVPPRVRNALESLRSRVIDVDASANAAAESLDRIPYLPRLPRHPQPDAKPEWTEAQRRDLGRMQSMVYAAADAAQELLAEYNEILVAIGVEPDPGDENGADDDGEPAHGEPADDEPVAARGGADAAGNPGEPDPRPSLGRVVVDFHPLPPEENADGVVTKVVEDVATRPFHRTPAEHEAALLTGAKPGGEVRPSSPASTVHPLDPTTHRS